eukprot:204928-Pyramimonas_sp.AAC.1
MAVASARAGPCRGGRGGPRRRAAMHLPEPPAKLPGQRWPTPRRARRTRRRRRPARTARAAHQGGCRSPSTQPRRRQ